jgi:hypothetical protein
MLRRVRYGLLRPAAVAAICVVVVGFWVCGGWKGWGGGGLAAALCVCVWVGE